MKDFCIILMFDRKFLRKSHTTIEQIRNVGFKHIYHLYRGGPATSMLSNLENINENLITIFQ